MSYFVLTDDCYNKIVIFRYTCKVLAVIVCVIEVCKVTHKNSFSFLKAVSLSSRHGLGLEDPHKGLGLG